MDVRAENRERPHQKVRFPAAQVVGRNFLTPGRGKSGPKSLSLCCFFFPDRNSTGRNGEKLTMKKWWIFGADLLSRFTQSFPRFIRDVNGEKKHLVI